jgi:hypothetical protein
MSTITQPPRRFCGLWRCIWVCCRQPRFFEERFKAGRTMQVQQPARPIAHIAKPVRGTPRHERQAPRRQSLQARTEPKFKCAVEDVKNLLHRHMQVRGHPRTRPGGDLDDREATRRLFTDQLDGHQLSQHPIAAVGGRCTPVRNGLGFRVKFHPIVRRGSHERGRRSPPPDPTGFSHFPTAHGQSGVSARVVTLRPSWDRQPIPRSGGDS